MYGSTHIHGERKEGKACISHLIRAEEGRLEKLSMNQDTNAKSQYGVMLYLIHFTHLTGLILA